MYKYLKSKNGSFGFVYNNQWIWNYQGKQIDDLQTLKMAAFEVFDNGYE